MRILSPEQIARIYGVTDLLKLNRNWIVVPLSASEAPLEQLLPDGKLLIHAPDGAAFEPWLAELPERLEALELHRTPRVELKERVRVKITSDQAPSAGPRKYLHWKKA